MPVLKPLWTGFKGTSAFAQRATSAAQKMRQQLLPGQQSDKDL